MAEMGLYKSRVPFYSQRAGHNWRAMGFRSRREAIHWERRACGAACLQMATEAITGNVAPPLYPLIKRLVAEGAYIQGKGWVHSGLASMAHDMGAKAYTAEIPTRDDFYKRLQQGLLIASVGDGLENDQTKGHLVLVYGYNTRAAACSEVVLHHPSSNPAYEWKAKAVPRDRFFNHFSQRAIFVH